jgi:hypothetical protein
MGDSVPTLTLVCRKGADDSNRVDSGSFNGLTGSSYNLDNNNHTCEIYWNTARAFFVIDNILIHTFVGATATLADTFSLSSSLENINAGGNDQLQDPHPYFVLGNC